ncbi:phosphotransferase [Mycolicibacterium parafortuitum]|uniref:Aminoglycoside phosphotransferase [Stackebrandtia nassauensis DSM] n=1 Tax=Mycolicibacterium parafortuitum TaxID=39692 RepID=A0A375YCY5_MYCPF|nr:phosphotransferase [Mycolicibacterium parafortuitum]ORB30982.1 phosphotransferase [Mycolicibacterium parafortuitum]SRX78987.1 aminoglycoside phosphotransferase [Stackebrandtia nassauensis DSM] [Mycolicibacterium parafortuitum]
MTPEELAERTRRATDAAVAAGRELGLGIEQPTVLHDVFSVVVHLRPEPVVARIPVVTTANPLPDRQNARQQRELDVAAWLDTQGVPVVPPSVRVPRRPVRRDGFAMTFWELADVAEDHEPYRGVDLSYSVALHAALRGYPAELPFLSPFNDGLPEMIAGLRPQHGLTASDIERARGEFDRLRAVLADRESFHRAFPGVPVQPVQGDAPSHNVIRTRAGILFSDFEDITCGPVEWDLAMLGEDAVTAYDRAAHERGVRRTDPEVLRAMESARRLQFVGCFTLIPQLPILAAPLAEALDDWRATAEFG